MGIGHTNAHVVKKWATEPIANCDLVCISKFPTATYSGMLPGTLGKQFNDDEMRIDLQSLCDRASAKLIIADTSGLDLATGQLSFTDHPSITFDALSIGVGSVPSGWQQHCQSPLMVPIKPMQTFLRRLDNRLSDVGSQCRGNIRVAIVGGGVAGIEIAFCLQQLFQKRESERSVELTIYTSSPRVADGMTDRSVRLIEKLLEQRMIRVRPNHRVNHVDTDSIRTDDQKSHLVDCVIWATGAAAPPVIEKLGLPTDSSGFIATSSTLQSLADHRIFAVGDAGTIMSSPSPKAGVYAVRHCPILWNNLRAFFDNRPLLTYQPQRDFLKLLNTGDGKALLQYKRLTLHARWCWYLKTWIDRRFIGEFQA
ncbi:MAG TPA: NADH dehydrogenase subunit [Planctomycetaceae bacterium]|nr:NADH dehydrogenase subunit [Planctomycetaceae bacterium]